MILTVTLNSAVDKTYTVENFRIDRVHRPSDFKIVAGGKGINVVRVYNRLGGEALATGFAGGHNGDFILEEMKHEGLRGEFIRTAGESRECIAIIDPVQKTQTELNEVGPDISTEELELLKQKFENLVSGMEYIVFCGSVPPSVPDTYFREMIEIANMRGVRSVLDTSGQPLIEGLKAQPFMVKPNAHELAAVFGKKQLATVEESAEAAYELHRMGIEVVVVTFGRDGAIAVANGDVLWAKSPEIPFVSAVGSGDSFAAAFLYALEKGQSIIDALKLGVGAGAANAMHFGAGFCTRDETYTLANKVQISELACGVG